MNTIIKLDTNNLLYEFIQSESRVELNSMYRSSYFFCLLILLIPKLFILTMIHNRTNLMTTNTQIIIFNIYCLTDLIFLVICFALIVFFKEKTKYDYRIIKFFKFYFPISANFLVLSNYFIPIDKTEGIMYTNLICLSIFIINCLTIQIIQKNMIFSNTDLIINFFFYLKLNIIFFVFAGENRSFIIEVIKIIYYLVLSIIIKHYSEINNKVKLLESSNQSFYKIFLLLNNNLINKTIILKKDPEHKRIKIFENHNLDYFSFVKEIQNDSSLSKLLQSLKNIRKTKLDNKKQTKNFHSKFPNNVTSLGSIIEQKEDDINEEPKKIIKIKKNKLVLKDYDDKEKKLNEKFTFSNNEIARKVEVFRFETKPNKISIITENYNKKLENSFDNLIVKTKNNNLDLNEKISNNIMISLIEDYDYSNLKKEISSFIHENFSIKKTINFIDLISNIINSKHVNEFCGFEFPVNLYFQFNFSEKSSSFLVSFKIQPLDFLKELNYIIILRDLEQLSKYIFNEKDLNPFADDGGKLIKCFSYKDKIREFKKIPSPPRNFTDLNIYKEFSIYSKNENLLSEIFKRPVQSSNSSNLAQIKIKENDLLNEFSLNISDGSKNRNQYAIPSLVHDFKNLSYDFISILNVIIQKLPENYRIQLKDEIDDISVLKSYMSGLIKMINDYSEGNGFLINSNPSEIDLIETINLMIRIFNKRLEIDNSLKAENQIKKNLKIHSKIDQIDNILHKNLYYNKDLILSLLYNILSNSYKSTQSGEILLHLKAENLDNQICICLYISDTGFGIPEHISNNWGKPFNKESKDKNSTGLGQFIINSIASSLGIYIPKPESKIKVGTTFKIFFTHYCNNIIKNSPIIRIIDEENYSSRSKITLNLSNYNFDKKYLNPNFEKQIIYILLCDDSVFILNNTELFLKKNLIHYNFEFIIKKSSNFFEFLNEINLLLINGHYFHFFILDYNIDFNTNGINIAKCALDIYKNSNRDFNENKIYFFYLTEENDFYENNKKNSFVKKDQIFNKLSLSKLIEKMNEKLSHNN